MGLKITFAEKAIGSTLLIVGLAFGMKSCLESAPYQPTQREHALAEQREQQQTLADQQEAAQRKLMEDKCTADPVCKSNREKAAANARLAQVQAKKAAVNAEEHKRRVAAAILGKVQLMENMRDPDRVHFSSTLLMPSGVVCYQFRAANGFGGMNVAYALLNTKTGKMEFQDLGDTPPSWGRYCAGKVGEELQ